MAEDADGKTAEAVAKEKKHKEIKKMLKEWQPTEALVNKVLGELTKHVDKRFKKIEKKLAKVEKVTGA